MINIPEKAESIFLFIDSLFERITRVLWLFSGAAIVLMAFVVGYGAFTRYALRNPDPYSYGITCILMLACVMFSIPYTQRLGRHLRIDLLDHFFSVKVRGILLNIAAPFVGLIFCSVLAWKSWDAAMFALKISQITTSALTVPTFPLRIMITICIGILCLLLLMQILRHLALLLKDHKEDADTGI